MRLLGLDPGLRRTGWGVIDASGNRLSYVADGVIVVADDKPLAERLAALYRALEEMLERYAPDAAAVEETFVNKNPASTLRLGLARGVVLLAPAARGIAVEEYSANHIKKSVVGVGHAEKAQVGMMVRRLLPGCLVAGADAADALAVAICHAHHAATLSRVNTLSPSGRGQGEGADRTSPSDLAKRKPTKAQTARARDLRSNGTDVERLLWSKLRDRRFDSLKFRRQESILGYTVDFVCHERTLIIELDGGQHATQEDRDERRTRKLEQAGFHVLRFWNNEVLENLDGVLETIHANTLSPSGRGQGEGADRTSPVSPSPQPSPRRGEGEKETSLGKEEGVNRRRATR